MSLQKFHIKIVDGLKSQKRKVTSIFCYISPLVSNRNVLTLMLVFAFAFISQAMECRDLLKNSEWKKPANFKATEAYRIFLIGHFRLQYQEIKSVRQKLVTEFFDGIEKRSTAQDQIHVLNVISIGGFPLDYTTKASIPTLAATTKASFERAFSAEADSLSYANRSDVTDKAVEELKKDPYFLWLMENKSNNLVQNKQPGTGVHKEDSNSTDPRRLFLSTVTTGGPTRLPWQLSLIRIYRDLDPYLSPELLMKSQHILNLYKLETTFHWAIFDSLGNKTERSSGPSAWDWAPSFREAKSNLRALLTQVRDTYEAKFPRASFEIAKKLIEQQAPEIQAMKAISKTTTERKLPPKVVQMYRKDLVLLRQKLQLPEDFPLEDLREVVIRIGFQLFMKPSLSYEEALTHAFLHAENENLNTLISQLKIIVELSEVAEVESRIESYITEQKAKLSFWY